MTPVELALGEKITIFIPTMNRSGFLGRCLRYYDLAGFSGHIIIIDSSEGKEKIDSEKVCKQYQYKARFKLNYIYDGTHHVCEIHARAGREASTPYFTFCGDDDVHSTIFLEYAQNFLDSQQEYNAIRGHRADFLAGSDSVEKIKQISLASYPPTDSIAN